MKSVLIGFSSEHMLRRALDGLGAAHVDILETYTPIPLNDRATGSPLPLAMFLAGVLGFVGFFLLMTYADLWAYPLDIGGRPDFAWPSFVPIAFELGVLCSMGVGFLGYFVVCRMPRPYDPIDECDDFSAASRDGWFVVVRSSDFQSVLRIRRVLNDLKPSSFEEFSS